jgi:hypothetical protein
MKKVTLLAVVFILLAATVVPVMAAGPGNSHGNGNNQGQGSGTGTQDQEQEQTRDQVKIRIRDRINNHGVGANGNQSPMRMRTPFYLQGTIKSVDVDLKMVTVDLYHCNAQVKEYLGTELVLQASDSTLIFKITQGDESEGEETDGTKSLVPTTSNENVNVDENETPGNRVPIPLDQLKAGDKVAIHGNVVESFFQATLITVYTEMPLGQPVLVKP